jgi:hypothetical protein
MNILSFFRGAVLVALVMLGGLLQGCANAPAARFKSADEAANALVTALRTNDNKQLEYILGGDADKLIASGDPVTDQNNRAVAVKAYDAKHSLATDKDGKVTIILGEKDWPMPIPIVKDEKGNGWYFDTAAGEDEIINRRIGRNELATIQVCLAVVDAQREYATHDPDHDGIECYAKKFISDPGRKNGLYWKQQEGEPASPLGPLMAKATEEGYAVEHRVSDKPQPFHGYFYRMLTAQGPNAHGGAVDYVFNGKMIAGFGAVAYPAKYGSTGIMTFIVNHEGVVYQKDLGPDTASIAKGMKAFDPGSGWTKVEPPQPEEAQ